MVEIDGSIGYGQVLRTAIGLSALLLKPVRITNIRKNRPKPGLMPQHLAGVKIAGELCNAKIKGASVGSTAVEFVPTSHDFSDKKIDIGTAGSISLLLQSITPVLIFSDKKITLEIRGGTAGLGAPTTEYTKFVTFPMLKSLGVEQPEMEILQQGFYPKGGGLVHIKFNPTRKLRPVKLLECGEVKNVRGVSIAGGLQGEVAQRQAKAARTLLTKNGIGNAEIEAQNVKTSSPGSSITIWADCGNTVLGSDSIGERGKRAEKVGEEAAGNLLKSIGSGKAFDRHMSDQIIPFIALARGRSEITVEEFTGHLKTNLKVTELMLGAEFEIDEAENLISVEGIGFEK